MTTSWNDYLLCQLSSNENLSALERLPAELIESIMEEVIFLLLVIHVVLVLKSVMV